MKAAVTTRYGPPEVLQIREVPTPVPGDNDVLVRVHATAVNAADYRLRKADPYLARVITGLRRPTRVPILGLDFAGAVASVGKNVTRFAVGDEVFGSREFKFGAHAEYVCLPEDGLLLTKPANMSFDEASAVLFGGTTALYFLRKAKVQEGQKVLVYGASGSVGVFTVQLAKHFGAQVTAVCSTRNLELMKSLGANEVLDYTREDFSKGGPVYDVLVETVGKASYARCLRALKRGGSLVLVGGSGGLLSMIGELIRGTAVSLAGTAKVIGGLARVTREDMAFLKELIEAGKLRTVIDRYYPLEEIAEAHRYAEAGHKRGHVVVRVGSPSSGER